MLSMALSEHAYALLLEALIECMVVAQVEELKRKADDTARALRAVGAKNSELEATINNLASSQSSSEDQLRSQAAQVGPAAPVSALLS